ncbi:hypothetical protein AVEN_136628-1 [Araneus ventricosus]|uniref:Uncharacterized protein n=1 Tax=Araneus ventricosus TaxID=182803 RepID=A0A4Y2C9P3_ARAVE|nr:hypothetical protein AVEN_136628-1 [Araneus ventricosus]
MVYAMNLFCATMSFQHFNSVHVWVAQFSWKTALLHTLRKRILKRLLSMHLGYDRIISRHFPTNWPLRSPDLNPCDFQLWGYLKYVVFSANLGELKTRIAQHIHNIGTNAVRSVVEHAISWFELVAENVGQHIEHFLSLPW